MPTTTAAAKITIELTPLEAAALWRVVARRDFGQIGPLTNAAVTRVEHKLNKLYFGDNLTRLYADETAMRSRRIVRLPQWMIDATNPAPTEPPH